MESWEIDPRTGDYIMDEAGKPKVTKELTVPAYFRLKVPRGNWLYAPSPDYGSDFYRSNRKLSASTAQENIRIAERALQPLIEDGRASSILVEQNQVIENNRYRQVLEIQILDSQGDTQTLQSPVSP